MQDWQLTEFITMAFPLSWDRFLEHYQRPFLIQNAKFQPTGGTGEDTQSVHGKVVGGGKDVPDRKVHYLNHSDYLVGRIPDGFCIDHSTISRQHAVISGILREGCSILDYNSKNGTYVREQQIPPNLEYQLLDRDIVRFGGIAFTFCAPQTCFMMVRSIGHLILDKSAIAALLHVLSGPDEGLRIVVMPGERIKVGTSTACHVILKDSEMPEHAFTLVLDESRKLCLEEISPVSGLLYNKGAYKSGTYIEENASIQLGNTLIGVRSIPLPATEKPASSPTKRPKKAPGGKGKLSKAAEDAIAKPKAKSGAPSIGFIGSIGIELRNHSWNVWFLLVAWAIIAWNFYRVYK